MIRKPAPAMVVSLLFSAQLLYSQTICDTTPINAALAKSSEYLDLLQIQPALEAAQIALAGLANCPELDSTYTEQVLEKVSRFYHFAAAEYLYRGAVNQCIDIAERQVALYKRMPGNHEEELADSYLELCNAQAINDNRALAIENAITGLEIRKANNPLSPKIAQYYNRIVDNYLSQSNADGALPFLNEWEALQRKLGRNATLQARVALANNWAVYYYTKGDLERAVKVLEDTLSLYGEKLRAKGVMAGALVGIAEFNLCEYYTILGNFERSLFYAEKNVALFEKRMRENGGKLFGRSHYAWCLAQSAKAAWGMYQQTKDTSWSNFAERRSQQAEDMIFAMRDRKPNDGFLDWMGDDIDIVANIAEVRQGLYLKTGDKNHAARAFEAVEASKTFAMQQFLHETYALRWSGLPDSLYQEEMDFRQQINDLETSFFILGSKPNADSLVAANDQKLFALRGQYNIFLANLETNYPVYFQLKYSHPSIGLQQVQQETLRPNQCMLDLYIRNDRVFAMLIRSDTLVWCSTPYDSLAHNAIETLKNESRQFPEYQNLPEKEYLHRLQVYADASYKAYQVLIEPVRSMLTEEVLIVPRNELSVLPFGALLTRPEKNMGKPFLWHFLENELVLSQSFSAWFLQFVQKRQSSHTPSGSVLAFAPFFKGTVSKNLAIPVGDVANLTRGEIFKPLPNSGEEAETIVEWTDGEALVGAQATKANFLRKCPDYKILHLATHSAANDVLGEYSFVAFQTENEPGKIDMLYARDIYGLQLSADLVVLSACESALGQYRNGEGIIGLTRAFTCAGARNVVASIWTVNDAATKDLMINFYKEIKLGKPYNQALAKAKRTFIKENRQYGHPYYWAGFVLNGR